MGQISLKEEYTCKYENALQHNDALAMSAQSLVGNDCKLMYVQIYSNGSSNKEGGEWSQPWKTTVQQSSKGLTKIYKMEKCRSCWAVVATQYQYINGEGWKGYNWWINLLQWSSKLKGYSLHWRLHSLFPCVNPPCKCTMKITLWEEETALGVRWNIWPNSKIWK